MKAAIPILLLLLAAVLGDVGGPPADEKLDVVTTLGVLGELARDVGGARVDVRVLADPRQDPHFVQPTPTLMKRAHEADALVEIGLGLELWAQKVADGSGNPRIQTGQPGRVIASRGISTLELPRELSREWGDVHPQGNPHVWLDPLNAKVIAENLAESFARLDPAHADGFRARATAFGERIDRALFGEELLEQVGSSKLGRLARQGNLIEYLERRELLDSLGGWLKKAEPLRGREVVTYHKTWIYFTRRFGLSVPIEIEEKPGIPPSARHRERVIEVIRERGVRTILQAVFYDRGAAQYLAEKTGASVVIAPIDVGATEAAGYFELMDLVLDRLLTAEARKE